MRKTTLAALGVAAATLMPASAHAIPAWARKYNINCSGCHAPAVPRLNAKGFAFKWAGYRMPEEIGENQEAKNVSDFLAARGRFQYRYEKTEAQSTATNGFSLNDVTLFAGGSLGKNYGAMLELAHSADGIELMANMVGVWGKESQYGGVRGGQMHWLFEGGVAGFDRPTGISEPTPLGMSSVAVPFAFASNQLGVEAFYVAGKNRLSFEVLNGFTAAGKTDGAGSPNSKDFVAIDQFIYDVSGSGLTVVGYLGTVDGLDTTATAARTSHYTRVALSANKIYKGVEVQGGYVYSRDNDLPVGKTFTTSSLTGSGYWAYGGYTFKESALTLFGRYEVVDANRDFANGGNTRFVVGSVLPVNLPEYLRLAAEYTLDTPRGSGGMKTHGVALQLMLNF